MAINDEDYQEALRGPMYVRIREGLHSTSSYKPEECVLTTAGEHTALFSQQQQKIVGPAVENPLVSDHSASITEIVEERIQQVDKWSKSDQLYDDGCLSRLNDC